ncbi:hypothetical protein ABRP83_13725 [Pectobacterium brasiliense]|uniref:hypothetical protein n=1 Tax=Pectobacterium brasiliense TaxID=180957 RepID=UPI0032EC65B6
MKLKSNQKFLSEIRTDVFHWQSEHECNGVKIKRTIYTVTLFSLIYICLVYIKGIEWITGAIVIGSCLLWRVLSWLTANIKDTWPEVIDYKLSKYKPVNKEAWEELKSAAAHNGEISADALLMWLDKEMEAVKPNTLMLFRGKGVRK